MMVSFICEASFLEQLHHRLRGHGLGQVYLSPIDVILSRITLLQPDLVYIERSRLGIVTERAIEGAPTLVVEVLSPSRDARDRGVKQALYARYGVPFYWIVDPDARTVPALRVSGESYEAAGALDETTPAVLPSLTGLALDPTAVWR
jgi:Uma2 family endonuclease